MTSVICYCLLYLKEKKLTYLPVWIFTKLSTYIVIWSTPRKDQVVSKWTSTFTWTMDSFWFILLESTVTVLPGIFIYWLYVWTPKSPAFPPWHRHILSDLSRVPGQRRKLSLLVQNIRVVSCISDRWWRLYRVGLIWKSHRLGVLADCHFSFFHLWNWVCVRARVCVFFMSTESETEFCVYSYSVLQGICS